MNKFSKMLATTAVATTLVFGATALPAGAVDASSSITTSKVTYSAKATTCNLYWSTCSWSTSASISQSKSFTHRSDVKAAGINVSLTISADSSAVINGNATSLVSATEKGTGKSNSMAGDAKPSILSVAVGARSTLTSGTVNINSGWAI